MRHLFNSRAEVQRLSGPIVNGEPQLSWAVIPDVADPYLGTPGQVMCRIDLTFQRPGKDAPMPITAGRAPDRVGVAYFSVTDAVKAGDRLVCLAGPVVGTFEVRIVPDTAVGFSAAHHMGVQVVEVAQTLKNLFPGAVPEENV